LPAGPVAQWLEPAAHNGLVAGSSPAGPTSEINILQDIPLILGPAYFVEPFFIGVDDRRFRSEMDFASERAAIHRTYVSVSQNEGGQKSLPVVMLFRLAKALGTNPSKIKKQLRAEIGGG
jgi:hypothetical protein